MNKKQFATKLMASILSASFFIPCATTFGVKTEPPSGNNCEHDEGWTDLHRAAENGDLQAFIDLSGIDENERNKKLVVLDARGRSPLYIAIMYNQSAIANYILENFGEYNPLNHYIHRVLEVWFNAMEMHDMQTLKNLLAIDSSASSLSMPLHYALTHSLWDAARFLIKNGAECRLSDLVRVDCSHPYKYLDIFRFLKDNDYNFNFDAEGYYNRRYSSALEVLGFSLFLLYQTDDTGSLLINNTNRMTLFKYLIECCGALRSVNEAERKDLRERIQNLYAPTPEPGSGLFYNQRPLTREKGEQLLEYFDRKCAEQPYVPASPSGSTSSTANA